MSVTSVSPQLAPLIQSVLNINDRLTDLQTQLSTGMKSQTYAGLGPQSGIVVGLNAQLAALGSYNDTITAAGANIGVVQTVLQQIAGIGSTVQQSASVPKFAIDASGQTSAQKSAADQLNQILSMLNSQGSNGYLFSGSGVDTPAVDSADHILNGNGAQAGLKQVIDERNQADLGSNGLGRLVIPAAAGSTVSVSEDVAGSPFGLKLAGVNSSLTGAVASGPSGSPPAISVNLAGNPSDGDTITYTFDLPDGSSQTLTLQATTSATPGANQFTIGATPALTAANLQAALTAGVQQIGSTSLSAASAMAASNNFFDDPPQRVAGPPFATATALTNGTSANTVIWYTGEDGAGPARSTALARIDQSTTVAYGTRANEQGIRWMVQNIAALAATSYSASDANASASYSALNNRVYSALAVPNGMQSISDIQASLASAQNTMASAQTRHQQTSATVTDMLQSIEGVSTYEVGAQILSLQTSLSASLSTTARLAQLNLLNYLGPA